MRLLSAVLLAAILAQPLTAVAESTDAAEIASLNLRNVDIRVLIDTVAEVTSRNFLVDPRVKGKVTVVSSTAMGRDELYGIFLSILQVHGYSAIPSGKLIKIVPDSSARQSAIPFGEQVQSGLLDQVETRVVAIKHVPAKDIIPVLKHLVPKDAHVDAYAPSNVIILTDRVANIERVVQILSRIDRPDNNEIEVIRLEHASSGSVVGLLNGLTGKRAGKGAASTQGIVADERTNSILMSGDQAGRLRLRGLIAHLDVPLEASGNYKVIFLRYAKVTELAPLLNDMLSGKGGAQKKAGIDGMSIHADKYNNALVVQAPPDVLRNIQSLVRQLDIRRAQVLVEAVIAEVSSDISKEMGVQLALGNFSGGDQTPVGVTNLGSAPIAGLAQGIITQTLTLGTGGFLGFGDLRNDGRTNWGVLVNALAGDAATNILSTPTIVATDNQEAKIVVGQNVPFVTGQYTNTGATTNNVTNPFQTIERKDIGITLKIRPQINEGSSIQLEIEQEVSSLAASSAAASDLVTNKRAIDTTVTVEDGQIIVLGGLIEDTSQNTEQKVPVLGDIPAVGNLFRYDSSKKKKQNLMVFLRPVILRDPKLAASYSARKYSQLRHLHQNLQQGLGDKGLINERPPKLPEQLNDLFDPLNYDY